MFTLGKHEVVSLCTIGALFYMCVLFYRGFPMTQLVKNLPAMQETLVGFLGWEVPLEKG